MDDFAFLTKVWIVRRSEGAESQPSLSAALSPRNGELEPEAGQSLSFKGEETRVSRNLMTAQPCQPHMQQQNQELDGYLPQTGHIL